MPGCCSNSQCLSSAPPSPAFRNALWMALLINALMFGVEIAGGLESGSVSLLADAVDFAGDTLSYALSLAVLSLSLLWRARAALIKGLTMAAFGVFVLGKSVWTALGGMPPEPLTMGAVAVLALLANVVVALLLYAFRDGDANMRSVWICSRNDALGNVAVLLASLGVFGTGSGWPDILVALIMASLAFSGGGSVVRQARQEITALHAAKRSSAPQATVQAPVAWVGQSRRPAASSAD